jgi:hypothetical protein
MKDRKSWAIKNEAVFDDLIALVKLTSDEKDVLIALQPQAQEIAPTLSKDFYHRLLAHPLTAEYVSGQIEMRQKTLELWFLSLFSGNYDRDYVQRRLHIGQVHVSIGLPIRYPLAMMDLILDLGMQVTAMSTHPKAAAQAFRKLLMLDLAIFNQAYEDTQLEHLAEAIGNERLARRILMQE